MANVSRLAAPALALIAVAAACALGACSGKATRNNSGFDDVKDSGKADGEAGVLGPGDITGGADAGPGECKVPPEDTSDHDGDGFSAAAGDCNDCDPSINPGAYDIPGDGYDNDCSGKPDDEVSCDDGLSMGSNDAFDGAKAMGLCKKADEKGKAWGVVSARYVWPDGTGGTDPDGWAIRTDFGVNKPQEGKAMLALSSGTARSTVTHEKEKGPSGFSGRPHGLPPGYILKEATSCTSVTTGPAQDGAAIELRVRVPQNAKSFSFQQNFFTEEFPVYICSRYNDRYVVTLTPTPAGLPDSNNIAFDQDGNTISVNNSFLQVCSPQTAGGKPFKCTLGPSTLNGTTFESHAATGWLKTEAPAKGGDIITLLFAIWDSGDGALDSTVVLDKFEWSPSETKATKTEPVIPK